MKTIKEVDDMDCEDLVDYVVEKYGEAWRRYEEKLNTHPNQVIREVVSVTSNVVITNQIYFQTYKGFMG